MNNIFLIFGYGVPKDIFKDKNYNFYLKMAFNKIYDLTVKERIANPIIICVGGMTDCHKPYKRSEAGEMVKFLKQISKKPFLKKITKDWTFIAENKSLSTLENFLNCLQIVKKKNIKNANFYIFYEKTREKRVKTLAKKILNKNYKFEVFPIDFDVSQNRYLDPKFLGKKEKMELKHSLWALESAQNLKKHHKMFEEKIAYFRREEVDKNPDVIRKWWESKMKNDIINNMKNLNIPTKLKYQEKRVNTALSPFEIFKKIEQKYPLSVFLESMEKDFSEARYSTICFSPYLHIAAKDDFLIIDGEEKKVENPYNELKKITKKLQQKLAKQKLPGGFCGGLIGYLSYEATKYFEPAFKGKKNKDFFDFEFGLYLDGLVFDNKLNRVKYFYLNENRFDLVNDILNNIIIRCSTPKPKKTLAPALLKSPSEDSDGAKDASADFTAKPLGDDIKEEEYKNLVKRAKENIVDGEIFQLIVSREYKYKISGNLLSIYEEVRKINPSPHMFFLRFADRYLIGSFPELVVQMENGVVKNFPIAGTRHRGKNATEDKEIAKGLLKDEKELAEHMMLIDLGRNDLGRICEFGSVKVAKKMIIKKFSHVMHICSEIHGKILKNKDMFDALAVSMPMGTVSGAPKVRAMELIDKYEKPPRGPYAGSIGYFSLSGDCKLTAGLRAIFISKGIGSIRAGAGIVYDSKPDYEFNETENKMRGMRRVVEK